MQQVLGPEQLREQQRGGRQKQKSYLQAQDRQFVEKDRVGLEKERGGNMGSWKGQDGSGGSGGSGGVEERLSPAVSSGGLKAEALPEGNQGFAIGNRARERFFVLIITIKFYLQAMERSIERSRVHQEAYG